jgi:PBP1b-binding outer membrane lipoprotein LpoB
MKKLITVLVAIMLLTSCGSPEIADVLATSTTTTATSMMSVTTETTTDLTTTTTSTPTDSPKTTTTITTISEPKELLNLYDVINDVEERNEYFEVIDSKIINLNNDEFDDVIVLSLRFMEANFSYYAYDGNTYLLLNDVKILRVFNFNKQVF